MSSANVWSYRETLADSVGAGRDFVGYSVEGVDGSIGKIDKSSNEAGREYVVVDTGFWIFGKKRLIPVGVVTGVDHDAKTVLVSLTKDQVKDAPDFDDRHTGYDDDYYNSVGVFYGKHGW
jgi:hypothetical protein